MRQLIFVIIFFAVGVFGGTALAGDSVPLVTGPISAADKAARLEVETVLVDRVIDGPIQIQRRPGKFILILVNKNGDPRESFVLETNRPGTPLLELGGGAARNGFSGGLFNGPVGDFQIRSIKSGKIVCQITIR